MKRLDPDKYYVIDIEANGLYNDATCVWCVAYKAVGDPGSAEIVSYKDIYGDLPENNPHLSEKYTLNPLFKLLLFDLANSKGVIGHNIIAYDWPLLQKLFLKRDKAAFKANLIDTLVMSRVLRPDMPGGHSLANWMKVLKLKDKVSQEQWKEFDPNMLVRCREDTEATEIVFKTLSEDKFELSPYLQMEHQFADVCNQITNNGLYFDSDLCSQYITQLTSEIEACDEILRAELPPKLKKLPTLKNIYKTNGDPTIKMTKWIGSGNPYKIIPATDTEAVSMERWESIPGNPNSPNDLRDYLLSLGWKPRNDADAWNYKQIKTAYGKLVKVKDASGNLIKTSPKLPTDPKELEELKNKSSNFIVVANRLERSHRCNVLKGFMVNYNKETNRIHMGINPCGATTTRVTHSVVTNIPRVGTYFGKEMRSLFKAPEDRILVGCDMAGLELRVLAHYLNDKEFSQMILTGDVHTYLYEKLKDYVLARSDAKNLTYAFLYGGGNAKLGSMCNKISSGNSLEIGKNVRGIYLKYVPNLNLLLKKIEASFSRTGGVHALDGRFLKCRNSYSALNTLCQSAGSILAKKWTCLFSEHLSTHSNDMLIAYMHDELVVETSHDRATGVGEALIECIKMSGKYFNLNIPLDGEFKIGKNWSEIH